MVAVIVVADTFFFLLKLVETPQQIQQRLKELWTAQIVEANTKAQISAISRAQQIGKP